MKNTSLILEKLQNLVKKKKRTNLYFKFYKLDFQNILYMIAQGPPNLSHILGNNRCRWTTLKSM